MKYTLIVALLLVGCAAAQTYPDSPKLRQCKFEATPDEVEVFLEEVGYPDLTEDD